MSLGDLWSIHTGGELEFVLKMSGRIAVHFNGNLFSQFGTNSIPLWCGYIHLHGQLSGSTVWIFGVWGRGCYVFLSHIFRLQLGDTS